MSIVWEQRIRHFDRPIEHRHLRHLKARQRKQVRRETRKLPSRDLPWALVLKALRLDTMTKRTTRSREDLNIFRMRLEWEHIRSRVLERKRRERAMIRRRKVTGDRTCINLWKRRRDWLKTIESSGDRQ